MTPIQRFTAAFILAAVGSTVLLDIALYAWWENATISKVLQSYFVFEAHPILSAFFGMVVGGLMVHFLGFIPTKDWVKGYRRICPKCGARVDKGYSDPDPNQSSDS